MSTKTPYKPTAILIKTLDWESLIPRIGMAQAAVARFDRESGFVRHCWRTSNAGVPDVALNGICVPRVSCKRDLCAISGGQRAGRTRAIGPIGLICPIGPI